MAGKMAQIQAALLMSRQVQVRCAAAKHRCAILVSSVCNLHLLLQVMSRSDSVVRQCREAL
jgi:hypothetical protein